jgi:hypothetical protein
MEEEIKIGITRKRNMDIIISVDQKPKREKGKDIRTQEHKNE